MCVMHSVYINCTRIYVNVCYVMYADTYKLYAYVFVCV